ncbi:universal stress protein [Jejuia pallidilutea]|uniref:Nucleotide-binding universal stress UspA family protein n=1 Tax=Jejuia pallidilutea TaxID=504487 RepID=A0A098LQ06_9FLAO|nr:universal stress protein [Jejuia pallidilutea]PQV50447.1 nucleotide-binding universal stress UspA family protein [Jejuia pallidilutea]GAL88547.1 putative universal stress protein UspA [Jejuia pallidilutea]
MKNILLPTDFSENSWNAITYALELFKNDVCTFYLLNTYTPAVYHVEYVLVNPAQFGLVDSAKETSIKNLESFKERIQKAFKNPNHTVKTLSVFNSLVSEVKDQVAEKAIDTIVMGTKGATGAKEVLFGSNTVHVLNQAKCPVLAIPDSFKYENPHELLFPTDYEIEFKSHHLNPIFDIAKSHTSRVNVLHVSYGNDLSVLQQKNKDILESKLAKVANVFHDVSNLNVEEAILDFQMKNKINMLIMINNKHSFFENLFFKKLIHHIGFHIKTPFLVIPSKTE